MSGDPAEPKPDVERSIGYATPRTDAATKWDHERYVDERGMVASVKVVRAEFAAQLERELAAAKAATRSEITPTNEQLNALFNYYRLHVIDKAPAPDLKSLHERQRAAWDAVFGVRP